MKNKSFNKDNFYKNAIIEYNSGEKEIFEAISITNKGIYTGKIRINNNHNLDFIDDGLISKENIKKIIVVDEAGKSQNIDFKILGEKKTQK
jgi:hypothetical protein